MTLRVTFSASLLILAATIAVAPVANVMAADGNRLGYLDECHPVATFTCMNQIGSRKSRARAGDGCMRIVTPRVTVL